MPPKLADTSKNSDFNFSSYLVFIAIAFLCLILGSGIGYYVGINLTPKKIEQPPIIKSAAERMIDNTQQKWGSLIIQSYAEFSVKGEVVDFKEGIGPPNGLKQGPGHFVTIKNNSDQFTFFVSTFSDWFEGEFENFSSWTKIDAKKRILNPGERIRLLTHAEITQESSIDSFFSWWLFREKK